MQIGPAHSIEITHGQTTLVPAYLARAGERASKRFIEFFAAQIRNKGTRTAYLNAVCDFFRWCEAHGIDFLAIEPIVVAAYIESLAGTLSPPTIKLRLAAIRSLYDFLVIGQIVPFNPAASVKGPKYVIKKGKTPALTGPEARMLLDSIDISTITGLRDRALIGVMLFSFARVSAVLAMNVSDYQDYENRSVLKLHEKGSKVHEVPVHSVARAYLDQYLLTAGMCRQKQSPLFRTVNGTNLSERRMHRNDALRMIKRRACAVGLPENICCHTWRATGITAYLSNGGTLEKAMQIACHESARTTKLYDRTHDELDISEIERICL
jgi:integrase/recombinase XerD